MGYKAIFSAILWVLISAQNALAYDFHHKDANRFVSLVSDALKDLHAERRPQVLPELVTLFEQIDRGQLNGEALVELKYLMSFFRASLVEMEWKRLGSVDEKEAELLLKDMDLVAGFIDAAKARHLVTVISHWSEGPRRTALLLLARHGDPGAIQPILAKQGDAEIQMVAGPKEILNYDGPNYSWRWGNDGWVGKPGFDLDSYQATGRYSAVVRGIPVRSGDFLLLDQGVAGGLNTTFSVPRSYATHIGLVVFLENAGKTYPAFFEIAEKGLRVLPLSSAMAPSFIEYGEIFRPAGAPSDAWIKDFPKWAKKLSDDVLARLPLKYYYDYYASDIVTGEETGVVCSTQVQEFLLRSGMRLKLPVDTIDPRAMKSLKTQLSYSIEKYITPTSYLRAGSGQAFYIGTIDNGVAPLNAARELVIGSPGEDSPESVGYLFSHYDLDLNRLQPFYLRQKFNFFKTFGPGILMSGLYQVRAPVPVLSLIEVMNPPLEGAVQEFRTNFDKKIYALDSTEPFSLHDKAKQPEVIRELATKLGTIHRWFAPAVELSSRPVTPALPDSKR